MSDLVLANIGELTTNHPARGDLLGSMVDAAVAVRNGIVDWVGATEDLPSEYASLPLFDAMGAAVVPGFVDAHTHAVFGGDRAHEHAMRLGGATYAEIQAAGGGIYATVEATRQLPKRTLVVESHDRLSRMLAAGTTTVEVKTGYGLDIETEMKMLDVIDALSTSLPIDIVATFLGAHVVAPEYRADRQGYVDLVSGEMLEAVRSRVSFVDVFCDDVAFSVAEADQITAAAMKAGLGIRLHADQTSHSGGSALAARIGATAVDHVDHATDQDLADLARAGTVVVLLPAVSMMMHEPYPDAKRFLDAGITVAIATDCNPGTANVETMPFVMALAATSCGMSPAQALWSATAGGAAALGLEDRGVVAPGMVADLVVLDAPSHEHLAYRPDADLVLRVVKRGTLVQRTG